MPMTIYRASYKQSKMEHHKGTDDVRSIWTRRCRYNNERSDRATGEKASQEIKHILSKNGLISL